MKNKVLLTGGNCFTGLYVRQALIEAGFDVFNLAMVAHGPHDVVGDVLNKASLCAAVRQVQPDYMVHLAAITHVDHSNESDFYAVNTAGTLNLLAAIRQEKPDIFKVVLTSSANIYGNPTVEVLHEGVPATPLNHYAMSKLAMDMLSRTQFAEDLPLVFTRPFNYIGVGQASSFLIPKIAMHFKQKKSSIELGNTDVVREFNDVRTVAQGYCDILKHAPAGATVNICSGTGYALLDVIKMCEALAGYAIDVQINPKFVR
jgi:GDP-6-deoxy-D-talose 4-dehydrogenase